MISPSLGIYPLHCFRRNKDGNGKIIRQDLNLLLHGFNQHSIKARKCVELKKNKKIVSVILFKFVAHRVTENFA